MEFVYPPVVGLTKTMFRVLDMKIQIEGAQHIPATGGAVLASNHVSYLDFTLCGFGAQPARRLVRFMAKKSVFDHKISGPLMRGMRHIPVDRKAGTAAFHEAEKALKNGEVVGVFPEATISESFTVKALKSGAARLAGAAAVPLIPMAVWGPHRLWTKGHKRELTKRHVPIIIKIGAPIPMREGDTTDSTTLLLRERLIELLDEAQQAYPDKPAGPDDRWWLPAHLGGTAPRPEDIGDPARQPS
ncbi:lysophospholipid acyltransferase family protein [Actinoplanes sp. NPDC051859]|uniref:lysophospholipid acyltransferase family protein n=1 Tax=Actinoplanes sp. NPDC051859 TaxID=3363909 RepID=UPI0037B04E94